MSSPWICSWPYLRPVENKAQRNQKQPEACPQNWYLGVRMAAKRDGQDTQNCDRPSPVPCNRETIFAPMHNTQRCTQDWRGRNGRTTQNTPVACESYDQGGGGSWAPGFGEQDAVWGLCTYWGRSLTNWDRDQIFLRKAGFAEEAQPRVKVCTLRPLLSNRSPDHHCGAP